MREELRRYLDGELTIEELPVELMEEAAAWDRLLADFAEIGPEGAPAGLGTRVVESLPSERGTVPDRVRELPGRGVELLGGFLRWLVRPRPVPVPPAAVLGVGALVAALVLLPGDGASPPPVGPVASDGPAEEAEPEPRIVYVEFVLEAPEARSVAVLGDFNDWRPEPLADHDGDGRWSARIPVVAGVHSYTFKVDDSVWIADPHAERYVSDGFGSRNAVLAVDPIT